MNIFLLGNGFDLHHKFPTAYIDFLHTIQFLIDNYDESMDTVAKVFGDDRLKSRCKNISDSFDSYESFYQETMLDSTKIKFLIEKAKNNIWFQYFSTAIKKELTWIDFEKEIAKVIKHFDSYFDLIGVRIGLEHQKMVYVLLQFSFFSKVNKNDFDWIYFWNVEDVQDIYIKENPIGSNMYEINKEKIISDLYKYLREFSDILKEYLKLFVDSVTNEMHKLEFSIKNATYPDVHCVFTFNYTNTVEKLYTSEDAVCHIHGNADNNIVLGVNPDEYDEIENVDTSFIYFKKYFQRVFFKTDAKYLKSVLSLEEIRQRNPKLHLERNLYVIGHSLDETDKDIIQEVFSMATKIKIFYHKEEAVGDYIKNLVAIYGKIGFDSLRVTKDIEFIKHEQSELYHS